MKMDYNEALVFMVMMEVKARYKPVSQNGERTGFWKDAAFPVPLVVVGGCLVPRVLQNCN